MATFVLHEDEDPVVHQSNAKPVQNGAIKAVFEVEDKKASSGIHSRRPPPGGAGEQLGEPDQEILAFTGFRSRWYKQLLFVLLGVCTGGLLFLVAKWSLTVRRLLLLTRCSLKEAQYVQTTLKDGRVSLNQVVTLQPAATASHPYLSAQHHPELLLEAGFALEERLLEFRCNRYVYVDSLATFLPVPDVPKDLNKQLRSSAAALAATQDPRVLEDHEWQLAERQQRYGTNEMSIPVKSIAALVAEEMWHPFYVFQYFSVVIWIAGDQYYTYAVCIFLITWFSIITSAVEAHRNMKRLAELAHYTCTVEVLRGGRFMLLPSTVLVPGDVIAVVAGVLPADCVLLTGECIVDENMLTGESVPVRKVPYQPNVADGAYDPDKNSSCTLYGGTNVAQARAPSGTTYPGMGLSAPAEAGGCALAMVARTRFYSAKGQLLRSILHPRESNEGFIGDSLKFIAVMLVACMGIFIWAAVVLARMGASPGRIVVRFLDMITVAVPPALPACLTIAMVFSITRLRKIGIFVTGPHTITVAGRLDAICFDKTGTLTVQGLELQSVVPVSNGRFEPAHADMQHLPPSIPRLLASCHGLAWLGDMLVGDPLDQKLFAATGWALLDQPAAAAKAPSVQPQQQQQEQELAVVHPSGRPQQQLRIVRRFEFTSQLMRNLVVVQLNRPDSGSIGTVSHQQEAAAAATGPGASPSHVLTDGDSGLQDLLGGAVGPVPAGPAAAHPGRVSSPGSSCPAEATHMLYLKGSPEVIKELVQPSSVPPDFDSVLAQYTREGLRVLALAQGAALPGMVPAGAVQTFTQQQLEAAVPLQLVGLAVLANPLRPDSAAAIQDLQHALIRTAMVTGDHVRTAISVAHQCHILPVGRPVLLVDGPAAAQPSSSASLSVLYPDGSVNNRVTRSTVLAQVMMGELECAVTGKGFDALLQPPYDTEVLQPVLRRGCVFARMSPDNKRDLIEMLGSGLQVAPAPGCPKLGLHVGFCGDGANDCGALKAAHVGVSLCEAEASVAAPMTSKQQSITSMISVVAEGRCALLATYQIFQFIVGYAMAQAFATNLLYTHALQMGNFQYLIGDLFFTTVLAALMGHTRPCKTLARAKPVGRVLSPPLMISLVLQLAVVIVFQVIALGSLYRVPWYTPTKGSLDLRTYVSPEATVMYLTNLAQFVILAVIFNKGHPHRQPLWTNWGLSLALVLQVSFIVYSLFSVDPFTRRIELVGRDPPQGLPTAYRATLLGIFVVNAAASGAALLLSVLVMQLLAKVRAQPWWQRKLEQQQCSSVEALLGHSTQGPSAAHAAGAGRVVTPTSVQLAATNRAVGAAAGAGAGAVHVPKLQTPSGAALL